MDRRDFTKLCASTAIAAALSDKIAAAGSLKPAESNPLSSDPTHLDAYVRREGMTWVLGTSRAERTIAFHNGQLLLTSFKNKLYGHEYRDSGSDPCEIRMKVNGTDVCSSGWRWTLADKHVHRLNQGELQLDIQLRAGPIQATKHWLVYPGTSIVREWITFENISGKDVHLQDVFFLNTRLLGKDQDRLELDYLIARFLSDRTQHEADLAPIGLNRGSPIWECSLISDQRCKRPKRGRDPICAKAQP